MCAKYDASRCPYWWRRVFYCEKNGNALLPSLPSTLYSPPFSSSHFSPDFTQVGKPREFGYVIKDHVQLGKDLDLFDFDSAAEVLF